MYLKCQKSPQVLSKLTEVSNSFYDLEVLKTEKLIKGTAAEDSFMSDDDSEKIKEMWAYHMPCILLVHKAEYWPRLKPIY